MKSSIINKCRNVYVAFAEKCMEIFEHVRLMFIQEKEHKSNLIERYSIKKEYMNEDFVLQFLKDRQRIITRNRYRMSITEEEEKGEEKNEEVVIGHVTLFCRKKFIHKATLITKPTCNNTSRLVFWKFEKEN